MSFVAHEAAEGDGRAESCEVHEDRGGQTGRAEAIREVGQVVGIATLDVVDEAAEGSPRAA